MPPISRRATIRVAGGAATVGAASAAIGTVATAHADTATYTPGTYPATRVLGSQGRHLVNRFSCGTTPAMTSQIQAAGGARVWFDQQLHTAYDGAADGLADWWPDLHRDPLSLWQRNVSGERGGWEVMNDYSRRTIMRRVLSPRPVLEVMQGFWEDHLHIPVIGDQQFVWRATYGDVIRGHALGRFEDMLVETTTHPAMLIFLNAATSTKAHPNENLGRELLELHTVGLGSYTEDDVKSSARILTGYHVDLWNTWAASYQTRDHWTGPLSVLGFSDPNASVDGRDVCTRYLRYLANHPATARHLARKLAVKFVRDDPPQSLVDRLAKVYLANGTAIVPVLEALVASPAFRASIGAKLRDPGEDVVATHRALGTRIAPPTDDDSTANSILWQTQALGLMPGQWPRPDGAPATNDAWATPARALASTNCHWSMAGGWYPHAGITYRAPAEWVPELPIVFRHLVDHLSRSVLQRPSTATLLQAACEATQIAPGDTIRSGDELLSWKWPRLMGALLDHPTHYTR